MKSSNGNISALLALARRNYRPPVDSPHKVQWRGALKFSLICAWTNGWGNNWNAGDLKRHSVHYHATVMYWNILLQVLMCLHFNDIIMSTMASQITSLTIIYSTVYSGADQRKHESSASLVFLRRIQRRPVNSPHALLERLYPIFPMFRFEHAIKSNQILDPQFLLTKPEFACQASDVTNQARQSGLTWGLYWHLYLTQCGLLFVLMLAHQCQVLLGVVSKCRWRPPPCLHKQRAKGQPRILYSGGYAYMTIHNAWFEFVVFFAIKFNQRCSWRY